MVTIINSVLYIFAPSIVDNVLGSRWTGAAPVIRVLAAAGLIVVVWDPVTAISPRFWTTSMGGHPVRRSVASYRRVRVDPRCALGCRRRRVRMAGG
jgi:hypothetical protein